MVRDNLTDDTVCPSNLPVIRVAGYSVRRFANNRLWKSVTVAIPDYNFPQPFPRQQVLDFSKLKEFANDNCKFDENCRDFSKRLKTL